MSTNVKRRAPKRNKKVACDLCYTKKIKCDLTEPQCSNCTLYKAECLHNIVRSKRKANHAKLTPSTSPGSEVAQQELPGPSGLGAALDHANVDTNEVLMGNADASRVEHPPSPDSLASDTSDTNSPKNIWKFDPIKPSLYYGPSDGELWLPPVERLMPIVEHYFKAVNPSAPIFSQVPMTRIITKWFRTDPRSRDKTSWAAILVIMALGSQAQTDQAAAPQDWIHYCMRNVQSVVPELLMRDQDLMGLQTLLGLAMLFYNATDLRAASMLAGMAVRLNFRFQMNSNHPTSHFTRDEAAERSNIFWTTYMLNKGLTIKMKEPALISDSDVNISLPPHMDIKTTSIISTRDGQVSFNIFRQRVELAHIEGKAFDLLYSPKSLELDTFTKQTRISSIQKMLDDWSSRIPVAFKLENAISASLDDNTLIQLCHMYHAYILCLLNINGVWSDQVEWMRKIDSLSRAAIEDVALALQGPRVTLCTEYVNPPLAQGWSSCERSSRDFLRLLHGSPRTRCVMWQSQYAYYTAVICLLANIPIDPKMTVKTRDEDLKLFSETMEHYNRLLGGAKSPLHDELNLIIENLRRNAVEADLPVSREEPGPAFATTLPMDGAGLGMTMYNSTPDFTFQDQSLDVFGLVGDFVEPEGSSMPLFDPFVTAAE